MERYHYKLIYEPDRVFPEGKEEHGIEEFDDIDGAYQAGCAAIGERRGWLCEVHDQQDQRVFSEVDGIEQQQEVIELLHKLQEQQQEIIEILTQEQKDQDV